MNNGKSITAYSSGSKFFHWTVALILILMLAGSFFLDDVPKQWQGMAYMMHKSFGLTILALMILRVIWIIRTGKPPLPMTVPAWQVFAARFVQYALYVFVILMPVVGWVMSVAAGRPPQLFGLVTLTLPGIPEDKSLAHFLAESHEVIAWIIIALLVLHVAGAFKHYFIDKDNVVQRMLPGRRGIDEGTPL